MVSKVPICDGLKVPGNCFITKRHGLQSRKPKRKPISELVFVNTDCMKQADTS